MTNSTLTIEVATDHFQWFTPSREEWLRQAVLKMVPMLEAVKLTLDPSLVPVSVGFPNVAHGKGMVIGVCHSKGSCVGDDRLTPVFVSPVLSDPIEVLATLLHELVHAALPAGTGHRAPFANAVTALGLAGKPTHTFIEPGSPLEATMKEMIADLGPYPHVAMKAKRKPGTKKWIRFVSNNEPSYRVDVLMDQYEEFGAPRDPWGSPMSISSKANNRQIAAMISPADAVED